MASGGALVTVVALARFGTKLWLARHWWHTFMEKRGDPEWTGDRAGERVRVFLNRAIENPVRGAKGAPPPRPWFTEACKKYFLPNASIISFMVAFGEGAIAVGVLVPKVDRIAAAFGVLMNLLFVWGGVISDNPEMIAAGTFVAAGPGLKRK